MSKAPPRKPFSVERADLLKTALECAKAIVILGFATAGLIFLVLNWTRLESMIGALSRFEAFGLKVEFRKDDYVKFSSNTRAGSKDARYLTPQQEKEIQIRGTWLLPVLVGSTILWVDESPENLNVEMRWLGQFGVSILIARTNEQALKHLESRNSPVDLVISNVRRSDKTPFPALKKCRVHWFAVPKSESDMEISAFNTLANDDPEGGFYLAEMMKEKVPTSPPIIYYTAYDQRIASECSDEITHQPYRLINGVFDNLQRRRWQNFENYKLPELKESKQPSDERPTVPASAPAAVAK